MMQKITIIGAGLMGHGIAHVLACAGHNVRIFDKSTEALARLPERLAAIAELLDAGVEPASRITAFDDLTKAAMGADYIIEAAVENLDIKRQILAELETIVSPSAIIATNTSALPITQIAAQACHPERVVGAHFWNPPHLVRLVEVVQGEKTSAATVATSIALFEAAGHRAVHVKKDIAGFIGNRLQHALKREAIALVADGVCDARTVDDVVKCGFGQRLAVLGPLEQSDMVGLNLTKAIHDVLIPDLDCTATTHPYLDALIAAGHTGMATGKGFYDWTPAEAQAVRDRLSQFLAAQAKAARGAAE
ncbi:3-hydroxyacyl-CoA dehydrogenase family protein [Pseudorhodobacter sp. W20_MBD10_FR17]|uniref:3-hydroxyacyl-CoA dehydrogenase family protein n=1 Tax=Pseudorhodobacter sp. W20_MBD10_FR17 TaxID=3240266 RepID=UPI003F9DC46E